MSMTDYLLEQAKKMKEMGYEVVFVSLELEDEKEEQNEDI